MSNQPQRSRPYMPEYGISMKDKGILDWSWVEERIAKAHNYWICSTRPDGRPHTTPVWGVWLGGALYFSTARGSVKARNLHLNPALAVHLESGDEAVIIEGKAEEVTDRASLEHMADVYEAKYPGYRPQLKPEELYYVVRPVTVFAWTEKEFRTSPTRWRFDRT